MMVNRGIMVTNKKILKETGNNQLYDLFLNIQNDCLYIIIKCRLEFNTDNTHIFKYVFQFTFHEFINNEKKTNKWKLLHNILSNKVLLKNGTLKKIILVI